VGTLHKLAGPTSTTDKTPATQRVRARLAPVRGSLEAGDHPAAALPESRSNQRDGIRGVPFQSARRNPRSASLIVVGWRVGHRPQSARLVAYAQLRPANRVAVAMRSLLVAPFLGKRDRVCARQE
jgi:hypothetical protein